jgi:hypothetical protein
MNMIILNVQKEFAQSKIDRRVRVLKSANLMPEFLTPSYETMDGNITRATEKYFVFNNDKGSCKCFWNQYIEDIC